MLQVQLEVVDVAEEGLRFLNLFSGDPDRLDLDGEDGKNARKGDGGGVDGIGGGGEEGAPSFSPERYRWYVPGGVCSTT